MTETKFKLTEKNYRYLFENASDAMWVRDLDGNMVDANKACEKLTGYTREEVLAKDIKSFLTGGFLEKAKEVRSRLIRGEETAQPYYEQQLVRKDGSVRTIKIATSLVTINGEPKGFQHIARDVTEEKITEEMLSNIIDGSPIPSFVIDKQHKITHWNTAMESLSNISGQEMIGTDGQWQAFYTEKRPAMADLIVDGASADEIEVYYRGKCEKSRLIDGAYEAEDFFPALGESGKWLHFTASPIKNKDREIIYAIETLQDVTKEKQLQKNMHFYVQLITRAQEEERKRIARELHDEMSTPLLLLIQRLDAISSHSQYKLPDVLEENLKELHSQAVEALEVLRHRAQDLRPRIIDDLGLVPALEWMAENLSKDYGIDAHVNVKGTEMSLPDEVQLLLFRIAQEALANIRRHAEASVAVVELEFGSNRIRIAVSDNGKGFEVPPQLGDFTSVGKLGIIGMSERARLLGGTLDIKSEVGKGTQVVAKLPLQKGAILSNHS